MEDQTTLCPIHRTPVEIDFDLVIEEDGPEYHEAHRWCAECESERQEAMR